MGGCMRIRSSLGSVVVGLVGLCGLGGCSPADPSAFTPEPSPTSPTTTASGLPSLFDGKVERSAGKVAPIAGGTLLVTSDNRAIASDPDRDLVHVVDLAHGSVSSIHLQEGDEPGRAIQGPPGTAYVLARRGGVVLTVDVAAGTAQRTPVCAAPRGAAYDAQLGRLYVACRSGLLVELDAAKQAIVARHQLDADLRDVTLVGDNLVVSRFKSSEVLLVSRTGEVLERGQPVVSAKFGGSVTPTAAYRTLALPGGGVLVGHVSSSNTTLPSGAGAYYGADCGGSVADTSISIVNAKPGASLATLATNTFGGATGPLDLAATSSGDRIAVLATGNSWSVSSGTSPLNNLWVTSQAEVSTGSFAASCGFTQASPARVAGEPVAVAFDASGHWVVQSREPAQLQREDGTTITLSSEHRFDTGFAMFHMNTGGGIACTSCHPEAGEDGHTWQFTVGPRRSQTLEGGVSGRAPFHWSGDLATFDDLVDEVMLKRMNLRGDVSAPQRDALRDWIDSVPKSPTADNLDADAVERGRVLFEDKELACSTCHAGADYTDNALHDVGTGGSFVTPSLVDVNVRAPLFHDGCALTLDGRFGPCGGGDLHGITSKLTKAERADLVSFMRSL